MATAEAAAEDAIGSLVLVALLLLESECTKWPPLALHLAAPEGGWEEDVGHGPQQVVDTRWREGGAEHHGDACGEHTHQHQAAAQLKIRTTY